MKKMLLILALTMFSFANAQKGSVLVMGSVYYNSETVSELGADNKNHYFGFAPKVGYQFHENWTAGVEVGISATKQGNDNYEYKDQTLSTGGFLRYSKPLGEIFSVYADLGAGFQKRKETYENNFANTVTVNKGDGFYIGVTPALLINVGKGFGLNFNIGGLKYDTLNYDENNGAGDSRKRFNFTFGNAFSIGISKNF
ncbi:outer membrane beta-barrel protein [Flavobacterium tructae]|uniref:outer membrane beta-barrel protein n=1 Tax=Flavobacterium tructae TaxID=1114873 RepID=UPI0035A91E0E